MRAALAARDPTLVGGRTPNNIRALRLAMRPLVTQHELAVRLACTQQEVASWETGARVPTLARAIAIAVALDSTVEAVFFGAAAMAKIPTERALGMDINGSTENRGNESKTDAAGGRSTSNENAALSPVEETPAVSVTTAHVDTGTMAAPLQ